MSPVGYSIGKELGQSVIIADIMKLLYIIAESERTDSPTRLKCPLFNRSLISVTNLKVTWITLDKTFTAARDYEFHFTS